MEDLLINIHYNNLNDTLLKLLLVLFISGIIIFLIFFILTKIALRKSKMRRELILRMTFLWALLIYLLLFNIYFFVIFYLSGISEFNFYSINFYLGLLPQLLVYILIIILFLLKRSILLKIISKSSLN